MHIYVDVIEEPFAHVLLGEHEQIPVEIPLGWLPLGTVEGLWVRCELYPDPNFTALNVKKTKKLLESLGNQP